MKNKQFKIFIALILNFAFLILHLPASAQVRAVYDLGAIGLGQQLKRLPTTASAMHTGAHPDDEDSGLLAYLARGDGARTAYLSLNRGDGGQNVIGSEIFETLGVIRTEELLQARRLDGGEQFFTRLMDYGFSKKREEAARIWGERQVLGDMVRAIRLFRPLVLISRFGGTPADGHAHHQLAGYLTPLAFKAAADANEFPEQITTEGLRPWQAKKLYVGQSFVQNPQNVPTLTINTGAFDALLGRSYFEIAMEGRSQHKSQEQGVLELRGKQTSGLRLVETNAGRVETERDVFDGVDVSIAGIAKTVGLTDDFLNGNLKKIQTSAEKALSNFDALNSGKIIEPLAEGLKEIRAARGEIAAKSGGGQNGDALADADFLLAQKEKEFSKALQMAAGVVVDALSDTETIVAGDSTKVAVRVFAPDASNIKVKEMLVKVPQNWTSVLTAPPAAPPAQGFRPRGENAFDVSFFDVTAARDAPPTEPYWLEKPRQNFTFDWSAADAEKNLPFQSALASAEARMEIGGAEIVVSKPVQYRYADDVRGEIRRDLNVVPAINVGFESDLLVAPVLPKAQTRRVVVTVADNAPREMKGAVKLVLPDGCTSAPASADFDLKTKGEKTALSFDVTIPANAKPDEYKIAAAAIVGNQTFDRTMREIAYPHIQTHRLYAKAEIQAVVLNLKIAPVRVGYIMGSGDSVPEAIRQMNLNVTMLGEKDLGSGDLSKFDTIVVGVRASQARPDFVANNQRILDFVKSGGTLIVQYQRPDYVERNLAPFPAKMSSQTTDGQPISSVRVVDENAPVKILDAAHPIFNFPNKITADDWTGWIQERNLYDFTTFDQKYQPLLESHDAGEAENSGGMVYADYGKGKYVYTSYSWFRQLPTGVPGAFRIFANLLSLPKAK